MIKKTVLVVCLVVMALGGGANADEISELKQQMQQMQQRLEQLEASQKVQEQKVDEKISKAVESKQIETLPDSLKWVENVKISGDLRYRYEMIDEENKDNRNRNRIRARLGIKGKVTDDVEVGFRLATSEPFSSDKGDPVSTNQTLDDAFSKKSIWLDLAYFKWSPKDSGLNIFGGKMENPFYRVGGNQLIWDNDLTPEGIAIQYTRSLGENDELFANGGGFWVNEVSSGADTGLWGMQGGLKHTFANKSTLTGGASYYSYGNINGSGPLIGTGFQGNSNASSLYTNDYDVAEVFGEYGFKIGQTPAAAFASYVKNTSASTSRDTGWLVGGKLGKCKDKGSWEFSYDYRNLEADAVLGAFSDSDFVGGGTDGKGHRFGYTYQLAKNLQGALTYFLDDKSNDNHGYNRLQADLVFKF
ncbi:MAG: putative porin [Phycisphaerae bacterium]|nr:putative porin [Phycisphaerae bacterium]